MGSHYQYPERYDEQAMEWIREKIGEWREKYG